MSTSIALDRLARPEICSDEVRAALGRWEQVVHSTRAQLSPPTSDLINYTGPEARATLARAVAALPARKATSLSRAVRQLDEVLFSKTVPDPGLDPSSPWWLGRLRD